jgi:molecular chaperone DnaK (HSP70)
MKRLIGRVWNQNNVEINEKFWGFKIIRNHQTYMAVVKPKNEEILVKPEEVSAEVLKEIKRVAETVTGQKNISKAVITVPAYFRLPQKYATKKAAEMAGLQV